MESLLASVQAMAKSADEAGRKKLIDNLNRAARSLEGPQDLMQRLLYLHAYIAVVRTGTDLKIFQIISDSTKALHADQIADKAGSAPRLTGAIEETGPSTYAANDATRTMAEPGWQSAIYHNFDMVAPCYAAMPEFLKQAAYKDPEKPTHCPFNKAFETSSPMFHWMPTNNPSLYGHFTQFMAVQRTGMPTWLDAYPYRVKLAEMHPDQPLFVDVGGSTGHMAVALRKALPADVKNRVIVQDLASVLPAAISCPGIEYEEHDFFRPQSVRNARMYYLRNIIHDWPDDKAAEILANQRTAMGPESVLLIDEMVMPEMGAHWQATQLDLTMLVVLGARERSRPQHEKVITEAGLKIREVYQYTASLSDCIIECVLP